MVNKIEKTKILTLQIDKNLYDKLVLAAKNEDRTVSNYVRLLIKKQIENK